ncbi:MAG: MFS transporter [Bacillota bacterium]
MSPVPGPGRLWNALRSSGLFAAEAGEPVLSRNLAINIQQGILSVVSANLIGPFLGIFAVRSGASNVQVAMLSSLPALMSILAMVPGAWFLDGRTDQKRLTCAFLLAHRSFYLIIAAIPLVHPDRQAALLVAAVAMMNLPGAVGNVGWQALVSRVIPPKQRAVAFATRNRFMNLAGTVTVLLAGRGIDILDHPTGYQVAFALAFAFAVAELVVLNRMDDASPTASSSPSSAPAGAQRFVPWRHTRFLRYTAISALFYLAWQVPWPVFTLYQVRELGANNLWISLLNLSNTGGALIGFGFWARHANRHGHLRTLSVSSTGMFVIPVIYAFSRNLPTLVVFNLLTGSIISGISLSLFNYLLEVTPEDHRTTYIASYTTVVNCSSVIAPIIGVTLLGRIGFRDTFLLCAGLRVLGSLLYHALFHIENRQARATSSWVARS